MKNKLRLKNNTYLIIGSVLLVIAVLLILWFLLKGETKVAGGWTIDEKKDSLVCEIFNKKYPLFEYTNDDSNNTRINVVFSSKNIDSISLTHTQYLDSERKKTDSYNINNGAMSSQFGSDGLSARDYGLNFSKFDGGLQMSIFVNNGNFGPRSAKYFLLDGLNSFDSASVERKYEDQGFKCIINN